VFQTGPFSFLVYTPHPYTTQVECRNGTHYPLFLGRMTKITIEPHCTLTLKAHHLQPAEHFHLDPSTLVSEWIWDPLQLPAHLLPQTPHVDLALNHLSSSLRLLKSDSQSALKQLSEEATLDNEFEAMLIKQIQTPSTSATFFWVCFLFAAAGFSGLIAVVVYYRCVVRKYPSLVEALESMQNLIPLEDMSNSPPQPGKTSRLNSPA